MSERQNGDETKEKESGDEEIHEDGDNDDDVQEGRLGRGGSGVSSGAPQPSGGTEAEKVPVTTRLRSGPEQEAPHQSDQTIKWKVNPELKQRELAPDQEAPYQSNETIEQKVNPELKQHELAPDWQASPIRSNHQVEACQSRAGSRLASFHLMV